MEQSTDNIAKPTCKQSREIVTTLGDFDLQANSKTTK